MGGYRAFTVALLKKVFNSIKERFENFILTIIAAGPLPQHVAIIMDGNRRFAKQRRMEKSYSGHVSGAENLARTIRYIYLLGVKYLTVYAFSVENFGRPNDEVESLMELLRQQMEKIADQGSMAGLTGVRVKLVGNLKMLPEKVMEPANRAMKATARNDHTVLNICVAYSSSDEIVNAVERSCERLGFGGEEDAIDVKSIEEDLFTAGCPEPDILIRTSGETRLSNFLLWQAGFCYLHACPVLWPEFSMWHLVYAIFCYQRAVKFLRSVRRKFAA